MELIETEICADAQNLSIFADTLEVWTQTVDSYRRKVFFLAQRLISDANDDAIRARTKGKGNKLITRDSVPVIAMFSRGVCCHIICVWNGFRLIKHTEANECHEVAGRNDNEKWVVLSWKASRKRKRRPWVLCFIISRDKLIATRTHQRSTESISQKKKNFRIHNSIKKQNFDGSVHCEVSRVALELACAVCSLESAFKSRLPFGAGQRAERNYSKIFQLCRVVRGLARIERISHRKAGRERHNKT